MLSGGEMDYDWLYLERADAHTGNSSPEKVVDPEMNLVEPDFSWWLLAYVVTQKGARKLLHDHRFAQNIMVIDEFIPAVSASTSMSKVAGEDFNSITTPARLANRLNTIKYFQAGPRLRTLCFDPSILACGYAQYPVGDQLQFDTDIDRSPVFNRLR